MEVARGPDRTGGLVWVENRKIQTTSEILVGKETVLLGHQALVSEMKEIPAQKMNTNRKVMNFAWN